MDIIRNIHVKEVNLIDNFYIFVFFNICQKIDTVYHM